MFSSTDRRVNLNHIHRRGASPSIELRCLGVSDEILILMYTDPTHLFVLCPADLTTILPYFPELMNLQFAYIAPLDRLTVLGKLELRYTTDDLFDWLAASNET